MKNIYTLRPRIYYSYDHWDNPQQLCDSAQSGCHLCTLIWSALSIEQQQELLLWDKRLAKRLKAELFGREEKQKEWNSIQKACRKRRCIRIILRSPDYMLKSREIELIPYFGSAKVPRRLMKPFRGFEEINPNDSGEFASPIRIDYAEPKCELLKKVDCQALVLMTMPQIAPGL